MSSSIGLAAVPPPELMYILPLLSTPRQPLGFTKARSYSAMMLMGVVVPSSTNIPPPRRVTNTRRLDESMTGQIGALSGRSTAFWQGAPLGVVQVARSRVAALSSVNVLVA